MKITRVEIYQVEVPLIPPVAKYFPKIYDILLCRILTDEGIDGIGESTSYQVTPQARAQLDEKAGSLVGQDPLEVNAFAQPGLFECPLLDIAGQAYGIPVNRFFGEKIRDRVPVSYWSCHMEPHETAAEAEVGAGLGFTNHKLKARSWDIVDTVKLMKEAAGPDYTVTADPNMEFRHVHIAARLAGELEPFSTVSCLEDPVLKNNFDWYRLLREKTSIPVALHIGVPQAGTPCRGGTVLQALKAECIDYVNLGGSAMETKRGAAVAEAADVPCWLQMGGVCLGVLATYSAHVQCTIPNATLPCDELPFIRIADVIDGGLVLDKGHFLVPEGPGLGVKLDMKTVEKYRVG
ncbi:MAG: enolase C-terminal domain-like protein [Planctomycetota bacterium]|jgi:L-alanine-DL-glutamate epimerase-like enolase superfamily enzyme|nr:enolase C-terminal domain-like protein [Planctomycetota bacterium]